MNISFNDVIKNSLLKSDVLGAVNFTDILLGLMVTLVISLFIFFIYRYTFSGVVYSHNYNVSLVIMALVTSTVIMTISSNLVLSLGMVGALSIVRFRTAVKDPLDIVFMFWAIAVGITAGAKLYTVALIGSLFIGGVFVLLLRYKNTNNVYLLIVHFDEEGRDILYHRLSELDYTIKSKTASNGLTELTVEVKLLGTDTSFVEKMAEVEGIKDVTLVSYNGNFVG